MLGAPVHSVYVCISKCISVLAHPNLQQIQSEQMSIDYHRWIQDFEEMESSSSTTKHNTAVTVV